MSLNAPPKASSILSRCTSTQSRAKRTTPGLAASRMMPVFRLNSRLPWPHQALGRPEQTAAEPPKDARVQVNSRLPRKKGGLWK